MQQLAKHGVVSAKRPWVGQDEVNQTQVMRHTDIFALFAMPFCATIDASQKCWARHARLAEPHIKHPLGLIYSWHRHQSGHDCRQHTLSALLPPPTSSQHRSMGLCASLAYPLGQPGMATPVFATKDWDRTLRCHLTTKCNTSAHRTRLALAGSRRASGCF